VARRGSGGEVALFASGAVDGFAEEIRVADVAGILHDHLRRWLRQRGVLHGIARKGLEPSHRLGRHRWVVERTVSWFAGCRRFHRRYERKAEHFLAFVGIAATLICCRRLGGLAPR
jgi:hypothetical protein